MILIVLFFVPLVNLILFLVLILLPTQEVLTAVAVARPAPRSLEPWQRVHRNFARDSYWRSGLVSLAITVPLSVLAVVVGAQMLQSYGFSLFVGAPFALGMISVLLFGFSKPQPLGASLAVAMLAATLAGLAVLAVALEGIICLIMAAPIAYFLALLGSGRLRHPGASLVERTRVDAEPGRHVLAAGPDGGRVGEQSGTGPASDRDGSDY